MRNSSLEPTQHLTIYGAFPSSYQIDRLKNLCISHGGIQTGPFGSQLHQKDYTSEGIPIITVEHLGDNRIINDNIPNVSDMDARRLAKYSLEPGDIVFSRVGSVDRRALIRLGEQGWLFSGRCLRIRPDRNKIDPGYLAYFFGLYSFKKYIRSIAVGATMPSLNTSILSEIEIPYPDLPEQRRIAHILGTLDDKIENNRKTAKTLEAMAQAIFKSWFVDFDPVRAKMAGESRESICKRLKLTPEILDLFPDRLVDSELGEIPEGWALSQLNDLCTTQYGYTTSSTTLNIGPKLVRVTDINKNHWIEWPNVPYCSVEQSIIPSYKLSEGDIVVARMADPGKSAIIDESVDAIFASYLVRLKPKHENLRYFVYGFLKSELYLDFIEATKNGSVQFNMNAKLIVSASLVVPNNAILFFYQDTVARLRKNLASNISQVGKLSETRDTLLHKLISGEISVPEVEHLAEEVTE